MIIPSDFADDLLDKIDEIIFDHYEKDQIGYNEKIRPKVDLDWVSKSMKFSLPSSIQEAASSIYVTWHYYQVLVHGTVEQHPDFLSGTFEETVESTIKDNYLEETIQWAIRDKIHRLVFEYDKVLEATKESNFLFGINDEEKILKIHLNRYLEVLGSDLQQISIFPGIGVTKEISDLVLKIYVRFIELRLQMLHPETQMITPTDRGKSKKITWKGTQKELLELFVELQDKGWIDEIEFGDKAKVSHSICNLFDLTPTQKKESSDVENSFYQILKGKWNHDEKRHEYSLPAENKRRFDLIKPNK